MLVAQAARRDVDRLARREVAAADRGDRHRRLRAVDRLHGEAAVGRRERLLLAQEEHARVDEPRALHGERRLIGGEQQRDLVFDRDAERIDLDGTLPRSVATAGAGASTTGRTSAERLARACATACFATRVTSSFVRSRLAAKPHEPLDERANRRSRMSRCRKRPTRAARASTRSDCDCERSERRRSRPRRSSRLRGRASRAL